MCFLVSHSFLLKFPHSIVVAKINKQNVLILRYKKNPNQSMFITNKLILQFNPNLLGNLGNPFFMTIILTDY